MDPIAVETQGFQFLSFLTIVFLWAMVIIKEKWTGFLLVFISAIFVIAGLALSIVGGPLSLIFGVGVVQAAGFLVFFWAITISFIAIFVTLFSFGTITFNQAVIKVTKLLVSDSLSVIIVILLSYGWVHWVFLS